MCVRVLDTDFEIFLDADTTESGKNIIDNVEQACSEFGTKLP